MLSVSCIGDFDQIYRIRGVVKKFLEMWYSIVMVGHMTTLT
jgi:hypothetical protein